MASFLRVEQQLLNCVWDQPDLVYEFDKPYFLNNTAQDIFYTLKELYDHQVNITKEEVISFGLTKNEGITKEAIDGLREREYDLGSFDFYLKSLKGQYAKNKIQEELLEETVLEFSKKGDLDLDRAAELVSNINRHLEMIGGKEDSLLSLSQILTEYRGVLLKRQRGEYHFPTGDSLLDKYLTTGFSPGEITTIFGATGVGKSTYVLNLINKQLNRRIPSVYFTLEMSRIATMDRLMSIRQKLASRKLHLDPDTEDDESEMVFDMLEIETELLKKLEDNFFLVDDADMTINELENLVKKAQKLLNKKYLIITLDLFTMLSDVGTEASMIEEGMNRMHTVAKRTGCHFVLVVQANRNADSARIPTIEQIDNLRPSLNSIKNSQAIAERSRQVLGVFRPKYYADRLFPESEELELMTDTLEIQVLKQSNGGVGAILRYLYDAETFRCLPYIEEEEEF